MKLSTNGVINKEIIVSNKELSEMLNREVIWQERSFPGYIRAHYDRKRLLSESEDVSFKDIEYFRSKND